MSTESHLLARCLRGEADAWDELFDLHYAPAARFIHQLSSDFSPEDTEEICQETFLTAVNGLHGFQQNSQFQTWLFRIAANKAHDYIQKQRAAKRGGGRKNISLHSETADGATIDPPSPAAGPDRLLIQNEDATLISQVLVEMGGPCQEVIELRYFADLSYEEIASTLNLNPKTVSSRLSKCLDKLEELARPHFAATLGVAREKKNSITV